jgi:hypothetical protein
MSGDIRLYLRLKPSLKITPDSTFFRINGETEFHLLLPPNNREPFQFSQVYSPPNDECCSVLSQVCSNSLMNGVNSSVFAVGSHFSGKTFTIFGDSTGKNIRKSLAFNVVSFLFEKLKNSPNEKNCSITLNFIEIFQEKVRDLALGYYKRNELRMNQVAEVVENQDLEIKEVSGRSYVEDASIVQVINASEALDVISMGLRVKEYLALKGDTVLCVTMNQKTKSEVQSARLYLVDFSSTGSLDFNDESSLSCLQKALNKANLVNLGVPAKSIPMKSHKITHLCQGSILNSTVLVIFNIDSDPNKFKETHDLLLFSRSFLEIDKKIKMNMMPHSTSARSTEWAKRLKDEISDLDINIKKSQNLHEEKLRNLGKLLGIDEDLELLVSGEKGTREYEICRKFREALQTVKNLNQRIEILEKKSEKFKIGMNEINRVQKSNVEKNRNYLSGIRNEIRETRGKVEDFNFHQQAEDEQIMNSSQGLEKMLYLSHCSLEEGSGFLNSLRQNIESNTTDLKNLLEVKEIVKSELENDFKRQIIDNDYFHKQQLLSLEEDFKEKMKQKYDLIFRKSHEYAQRIREIDRKFQEFQGEAARLFEVTRLQGKAIHQIETGKFNKGISPVLIPRSHIPPVPSLLKFPLIFSGLGSSTLEIARVSSKVKSQFSFKKQKSSTMSQSSYEKSLKVPQSGNFSVEFSIEALLKSNIDQCGITELRTIGTQLQRLVKETTGKIHQVNKNLLETQKIIKESENEFEVLKGESLKLKEMYQEMFKKRLEMTNFESRPVSRAFLTDLSRPGTQRNVDTNSRMMRNVYTTVSGHRLPYSQSALNVKIESARPFTTTSRVINQRKNSNI